MNHLNHQALSNGNNSPPDLISISQDRIDIVTFHQELMKLHQSSMDTEILVETAMNILQILISHGWCGILYRHFSEKKFYIYTSIHRKHTPIELKMKSRQDYGLIRKCIEQQDKVQLEDFNSSHELFKDVENGLEMNISNLLSLPVVHENYYYGCVIFENSDKSYELQSLISIYLQHISLSFHHNIQNQVNQLFYKIAMERSLDIPFSNIIHQFIVMIEQLLDCEHGTIYFCNHYHNEIWYIAQYEGYHDSFGQDIVGKVARKVLPVRENSCSQNGNIHSLLCVPVIGINNSMFNLTLQLNLHRRSWDRRIQSDCSFASHKQNVSSEIH